jgi:hypothetical protein
MTTSIPEYTRPQAAILARRLEELPKPVEYWLGD